MEYLTCSIEQCERPKKTRGWCSAHYQQFLKWDDPLGGGPSRNYRRAVCTICGRPAVARGLCSSHYSRWQRHGDPLGGGAERSKYAAYATIEERFRSRYVVADNGCHIWKAALTGNGYGAFWENGRQVGAHVWAWEQLNGPVPAGLHLDHFVCDTPACCNPEHVRPVTPRENTLRASNSVSAINARKTHCVREHEFTPENTHTTPDGNRRCKTCMREWRAATA